MTRTSKVSSASTASLASSSSTASLASSSSTKSRAHLTKRRNKTSRTAKPRAKKLLPISDWKFRPWPQGNRMLERPRLVDEFEPYLGKDEPIGQTFIVTAPHGYGKTVAMAQWAKATAVATCWYHLDENDNDPVVFFRGVVQALRGPSSRSRWEVETIFQDLHASTPSPTDLQRAVATLIADIQQHIRKPLALLLTGVSSLIPNGVVYELLGQLIAREPDHLRLVIETCEPLHFDSAASLTFSYLLTQHRINGIGTDELRLNDAEFTELLNLLRFEDTPERIEELRKFCAGWVTGVLLGTGSLLPPGAHALSSEEDDRQRMFDYLTHQVINRLSDSLRTFVMQVAVLPVMTIELCEQLVNSPDARPYLVALEQQNVFTTRLGQRPAEAFYQFQPFFRQALLRRLEQTAGVEQRCQLQKHAGVLLEARGDWEHATQQYAGAGAFEQVASVIEAKYGEWLRAGRGVTLAQWIGLLPDTIRQQNPQLQVLLAEIRYQEGNYAAASTLVECFCEQALENTQGNRTEFEDDAFAEICSRALKVQGAIAFDNGRYEEAQSLIQQALRLAPQNADEVRISAGLLYAATLSYLANPREALRYLEDLEDQVVRQGDLWTQARICYQRSRILLTLAQPSLAEKSALAALRFAQEVNDELTGIKSRLNLGTIAQRSTRLRVAREHFELAQARSEAAGYALGEAYALGNLADLDFNSGAYESAIEHYQQALRAEKKTRDALLYAGVLANLGTTLTMVGRMQEAVELLEPEIMSATLSSPGHQVARSAILTSLGYAYLRLGDTERAAETLTTASEIALLAQAFTKYVCALLPLAATYHAQGQSSEALKLLDMVLCEPAASDTPMFLVMEIRQLPELIPLLEHSTMPIAQRLLQVLAEPTPATKTKRSSDKVRLAASEDVMLDKEAEETTILVYALGEPHILIDNTRLEKEAWHVSRARELFYFFLDQDRPVSTREILKTFWEAVAEEPANRNFKDMRYRINQMFGYKCVESKNGHWYLDMTCWFDLREFKQCIAEGKRDECERQLIAAEKAYEQALTFWTGGCLSGFTTPWAISRSEEVWEQYRECLEHLAGIKLRLGRGNEAEHYYSLLLQSEPAYEEAHLGLMRYFAHKGDKNAAIQQYWLCLAALEKTFGPKTAPMEEISQLYNALVYPKGVIQPQTKSRFLSTKGAKTMPSESL